MAQKTTAPAMSQDHRTIRGKDSHFLDESQLIAPCFSCAFWHTCAPFAWMDCGRFGLFIRAYKNELWLRKRAERETTKSKCDE